MAAPSGPAKAQQVAPVDLVDALNGLFGKHAGDRAAHTKGICLTGTFTPSADAAKLSKAPHFAKEVPVIARFSLGGGNPSAPDNAQDNVRGLAVKFDLGNGANTDLVTISAPMFFVQTPALFVEFLKTVATGDQDKLKAFFAAHPESTRQNAWLTSHPVPASYAGVGYWGVHAFTFTNAAGEATLDSCAGEENPHPKSLASGAGSAGASTSSKGLIWRASDRKSLARAFSPRAS